MRPSLFAALAGCAMLGLLAVPIAASTDCPYNTMHCPAAIPLPGSNSGGISFNINGARVSVVLKADANTQTADGTPSIEAGAGGVLGITLDDDPDSTATGEVDVHLAVPEIGGWSWDDPADGTGYVNRTFTFDLAGGARVEVFSFEVPAGAEAGDRTFDLGVFVDDAGNRVPLSAVVVEPGSSATSGSSPTEPASKPSPSLGVAAGAAAVAVALLLRRRQA